MSNSFEPKILAFLCNWCSYAGADLAGVSRMQYPHNIRVIRFMCTGRIDPLFIIKALTSGVDGVIIAGCHPGECHYGKGNLYTRRRILMTKKLLECIGIDPDRLRLEWVAASEGPKFAQVIRDFTEETKKLGLNPLEALTRGEGLK